MTGDRCRDGAPAAPTAAGPTGGAHEATRYVSVSSAGTLGNAYFGVLDALERHMGDYEAWRQNLLGVSGCSAGCIVALSIALGLSADARAELHDMFDVRRIVGTPDVARLAKEYGVDDGRGLREAVQHMLMRGGLSAHSTLGDLRRLLRIDFVCACTDLNAVAPVYLSSMATPHVGVCDAILASCAVPLLFCPRVVDGRQLVDGCLTCSQPEAFDEDATLFVDVLEDYPDEVRGWNDYLCRVVRCAMIPQHAARAARAARRPARSIHLRVPRELGTMGFDVAMERSTRAALARCGFVGTLDALSGGRVRAALARALRAYIDARATTVLLPPLTEAEADERAPPCA